MLATGCKYWWTIDRRSMEVFADEPRAYISEAIVQAGLVNILDKGHY